jgi:hypothetical protein
MRGKGIPEGQAHQRDAEEFAKRYVDEEQGRNRKHVLDSHKLQIKNALFRKNQHYTGGIQGMPELTDEELEQEVMSQIRREKAYRNAGGKRRRTKKMRGKRRYTKKR